MPTLHRGKVSAIISLSIARPLCDAFAGQPFVARLIDLRLATLGGSEADLSLRLALTDTPKSEASQRNDTLFWY